MAWLQRRWLLLLIGAVLLFNLGYGLGWVTIWSGAEAEFISRALYGGTTIPEVLVGRLGVSPSNILLLRLPGIGIYGLLLAATYALALPVFGPRRTPVFVLVLALSWCLPNLARVATRDVWLLTGQLLGTLGMLRFIKQPAWSWRLLAYSGILLAFWMSPLTGALYFAVLPLIWAFFHPAGRRMVLLNPWLFLLLLVALRYYSGQWSLDIPTLYVDFLQLGFGRFLLLNLLGILPFVAFALVGVYDAIRKWLKGEEMAVLLLGWLAAALVSQSIVAQVPLAFLAARHLADYFQPNYPYRNGVNTVAILHLTVIFLLALLVLLGGYVNFGQLGFQAGLGASLVYWGLQFIGVLGLFGGHQDRAMYGFCFSALFTITLFWVQLYPLIEVQRDLPKDTVAQCRIYDKKLGEAQALYLLDETETHDNLLLYAREYYPEVRAVPEPTELIDPLPHYRIQPLGNCDTLIGQDTTLLGWSDLFRSRCYGIIRMN